MVESRGETLRRKKKPGMEMHAIDPSTWEAEAGGLRV
jgi:hypothetical protein